jgi:hypothetical protein
MRRKLNSRKSRSGARIRRMFARPGRGGWRGWMTLEASGVAEAASGWTCPNAVQRWDRCFRRAARVDTRGADRRNGPCSCRSNRTDRSVPVGSYANRRGKVRRSRNRTSNCHRRDNRRAGNGGRANRSRNRSRFRSRCHSRYKASNSNNSSRSNLLGWPLPEGRTERVSARPWSNTPLGKAANLCTTSVYRPVRPLESRKSLTSWPAR